MTYYTRQGTHAEDRAVQIHVFMPGELRVEARTDLKETRNPTA
jgi:hypothetical protein